MTEAPNADEAEYWSGPSVLSWIEREEEFDASFGSVTDLILERAALSPGERVLDIGCGTARELAEFSTRVGHAARVIHHFDATDSDRAAIAADMTSAYQPFVRPSGVHIPATVTLFTATLS